MKLIISTKTNCNSKLQLSQMLPEFDYFEYLVAIMFFIELIVPSLLDVV